MKNLPQRFEQTIRERHLLPPRGRVLIAVSGGLDSMVLLHLLHQLAPGFRCQLFVAHYNHQLRGHESNADEQFVRGIARALELPFRSGRGSVKTLAKQRGLSLEMAARELRHKFLAQTAGRLKCSVIAMAHHADDQVELFFLRLLRGAGGDGLAGMKWSSPSPLSRKVQIVRPLLEFGKEAIEEFARANGIQFRSDDSNNLCDILRNRVRHELLPLLRRRFQPTLEQAVLRMMDTVGGDAVVAIEAARSWLKLGRGAGRFSEQLVGLQRRVIQQQLQEQGIEVDFDLIETLRLSLGKPVTVGPGRRIRCDVAGRVSEAVVANKRFNRRLAPVRLDGDSGEIVFSGAKIRWRKTTSSGPGLRRAALAGQEAFDADRVGSRIVLRHWQPGDRFQPIGMASAVKLQDWFTNRKVAPARRRGLIVAATAGGEIFWVEDQRIGEHFKLTSSTRRKLNWHWNRP